MTREEIIKAVREHALKHYNEGGWDYVVECWEDSDIEKAIAHALTLDGAIKAVGRLVGIVAEQRKEAWVLGGLCGECGSFEDCEHSKQVDR